MVFGYLLFYPANCVQSQPLGMGGHFERSKRFLMKQAFQYVQEMVHNASICGAAEVSCMISVPRHRAEMVIKSSVVGFMVMDRFQSEI